MILKRLRCPRWGMCAFLRRMAEHPRTGSRHPLTLPSRWLDSEFSSRVRVTKGLSSLASRLSCRLLTLQLLTSSIHAVHLCCPPILHPFHGLQARFQFRLACDGLPQGTLAVGALIVWIERFPMRFGGVRSRDRPRRAAKARR